MCILALLTANGTEHRHFVIGAGKTGDGFEIGQRYERCEVKGNLVFEQERAEETEESRFVALCGLRLLQFINTDSSRTWHYREPTVT